MTIQQFSNWAISFLLSPTLPGGPYMPIFPALFIILSWICLRVIWFLTDTRDFLTRMTSVGWVSVGLIVIGGLQMISRITGLLMFVDSIRWLIWLGYGLFIGGWGLAVWAKLTMKESWGEPGKLDQQRQKNLITQGPFRFTRNPIYVGLLMMVLGSGLILQTYLVGLGLVVIWYVRKKILKEEMLLEKYYGKAYRLYKRKVRRWV